MTQSLVLIVKKKKKKSFFLLGFLNQASGDSIQLPSLFGFAYFCLFSPVSSRRSIFTSESYLGLKITLRKMRTRRPKKFGVFFIYFLFLYSRPCFIIMPKNISLCRVDGQQTELVFSLLIYVCCCRFNFFN